MQFFFSEGSLEKPLKLWEWDKEVQSGVPEKAFSVSYRQLPSPGNILKAYFTNIDLEYWPVHSSKERAFICKYGYVSVPVF